LDLPEVDDIEKQDDASADVEEKEEGWLFFRASKIVSFGKGLEKAHLLKFESNVS